MNNESKMPFSMKRLIINKFGPISYLELDLKKLNFFIGPQSSGKSTIAKVISTCLWIEKEVATTMDESVVASSTDFENLLIHFHRMYEYFYDDTMIHYESDVISILYQNKTFRLYLKSKEIYERIKISYMPAERNMITSPELMGFEFGQTSLRSFLFDWYSARELYNESRKIGILDFDVKYFFNPYESKFKDRIVHTNGISYNIPLYAASSGLQSVVPLQVMLEYYTNGYFDTYEHRTSFDNDAKIEAIRKKCVVEYVLKQYYPNYQGGYEKEIVAEANRKITDGDSRMIELSKDYRTAFNRLTIPAKTEFIIEEPEQNLYPFAQVALLEKMVEAVCGERNHGLTVTTHSPFILNYINVLLMRHNKSVLDKPLLSPEDINVYVVSNGTIVDLKQVNTVTGQISINAEDLVEPMRAMYEEYKMLKCK